MRGLGCKVPNLIIAVGRTARVCRRATCAMAMKPEQRAERTELKPPHEHLLKGGIGWVAAAVPTDVFAVARGREVAKSDEEYGCMSKTDDS